MEGKANSKIKTTAKPAGVIDMLAPPPPRRPGVHPPARSLARSLACLLACCGVVGVHSFFLLILLFPQTGSQALIQRHWLPHGNPPPGSVRATERTRGVRSPSATLSCSTAPRQGTTLFHPPPRLLRSPAAPVSSATFSYSTWVTTWRECLFLRFNRGF